MKTHTLAPLFMGSAFLIGLSLTSASATPPPKGITTSLAASVVCDTQAQVEDIVKASTNTKGAGLKDALKKWMAIINKDGEPTCAYQPVMGVVIGENVTLPDTFTDSGIPVHAWAVHFGTSKADGWALYGELAVTTPNPSAFQYDEWSHERTLQGV